MKLLVTEWYHDWGGKEPQVLKPAVKKLDETNDLMWLIIMLGNETFDEVCFEAESQYALEVVCGAPLLALEAQRDRANRRNPRPVACIAAAIAVTFKGSSTDVSS